MSTGPGVQAVHPGQAVHPRPRHPHARLVGFFYNSAVPNAFERLREFIDHRMRMSHVYQPVLETLLANGGTATAREIAAAILAHDESSSSTTNRSSRGCRAGYSRRTASCSAKAARSCLTWAVTPSATEVEDLIARCRRALEAFKRRRGEAIWQHRAVASGLIPRRVHRPSS